MVAVFLFKESNMFLKTNRFLNEFPEYLNLRHQVHQNRNIIILCVYLKLRPKFSSLEPEHNAAAASAKLLQSCLTLCDPRDSSSVPGILQAKILEWVTISFSMSIMS